MREGWVGNEYLILYEGDEPQAMSASYSFAELLPGYRLIGLRNWNDFIVDDKVGHLFTVPTVPVETRYMAPFQLPAVDQTWKTDEQLINRIKWYVTPLVFGGDPSSHQNETWVSHEQHAQLVRYWNQLYRSTKATGHLLPSPRFHI